MMNQKTLLIVLLAACVMGVAAGRTLMSYGMPSSMSSSNKNLVTMTKQGAKTIYNVTWTQVAPNSYEDIVANCGDEVIFTWAGNTHDVAIADGGDCSKIGDSLSPAANSGSFRVVLDNTIQSIREDGEVYFACSVGRHCSNGKQLLEFYVDCDTNSTVAAPAPAPAALTTFG